MYYNHNGKKVFKSVFTNLFFFAKIDMRGYLLFGHYTYILWLALFVWLPILIIYLFNREYINKYRNIFPYGIVSTLLFSIPWDWWAIKTNVWYFPPQNIVGVWFFGIPLEEYLFMIFVTFEIAFITLALRKKLTQRVS